MGEYNRRGMHIYGANVQLARAIPNIMDGFKPVARRTLYAMAKISHADKKLKKALNVKGDVIKIHPHGDSSIDDLIADLGKDWEMAYPPDSHAE
jgi:DNA gyrase subunit A